MSIPEAVHLILRAAALGFGGETFVFDMGEPVNICELAKTMMLYSGLRPGRDIQIEFIGLHPGEKIHEELWEATENPAPSGSDHILVLRDRNSLSQGILAKINRVEELLLRGNENEALKYLCALFPEFRWNRTSLTEQGEKHVERAMARAVGTA